jgi:hypothetical protein
MRGMRSLVGLLALLAACQGDPAPAPAKPAAPAEAPRPGRRQWNLDEAVRKPRDKHAPPPITTWIQAVGSDDEAYTSKAVTFLSEARQRLGACAVGQAHMQQLEIEATLSKDGKVTRAAVRIEAGTTGNEQVRACVERELAEQLWPAPGKDGFKLGAVITLAPIDR